MAVNELVFLHVLAMPSVDDFSHWAPGILHPVCMSYSCYTLQWTSMYPQNCFFPWGSRPQCPNTWFLSPPYSPVWSQLY